MDYKEHMAVGTCGGFGIMLVTASFGPFDLPPSGIVVPPVLLASLQGFAPVAMLLELVPTFAHTTRGTSITAIIWKVLLVVAIACLSTWPDVDLRHSKPAQMIPPLYGAVWAYVGLIGGCELMPAHFWIATLIGARIGWDVGEWLGSQVRDGLGACACGHRGLTHSLLLTFVLVLLISLLLWHHQTGWAIYGGLLIIGQLLHLVGDGVGNHGVRLFWPLKIRSIKLDIV